MVFVQPLIDIAIFYATGRSPRFLEREKVKRLNAIIEDFILNNNVNKIESSMQQIVQEGYDPKCIQKIFKILQVKPYSEIKDKIENSNNINPRQITGIPGPAPEVPFQNPITDPLDPTNRHRHRSPPWTTEEDERLIAGIFHYGFSDWQKVSTFVGKGRTRSQCGQRWLRCLDPNMNREKWTPEEDATLKKLVDLYGTHSWSRISKEIGTRTDVQCRYRYVRCVKEPPNFLTSPTIQFTNYATNTLFQAIQHQPRPPFQNVQPAEPRIIQQKPSNLLSSNDVPNSTMILESPTLPHSVGDTTNSIIITDNNPEDPKDIPLAPFAYQNVLPLIKPQILNHNLHEANK